MMSDTKAMCSVCGMLAFWKLGTDRDKSALVDKHNTRWGTNHIVTFE